MHPGQPEPPVPPAQAAEAKCSMCGSRWGKLDQTGPTTGTTLALRETGEQNATGRRPAAGRLRRPYSLSQGSVSSRKRTHGLRLRREPGAKGGLCLRGRGRVQTRGKEGTSNHEGLPRRSGCHRERGRPRKASKVTHFKAQTARTQKGEGPGTSTGPRAHRHPPWPCPV